MPDVNRVFANPRLAGLICAVLAVGSGALYLAVAGAPPRYLVVNLAALGVGAGIWLGLGRWRASRCDGGAVVALAASLLATAVFGAAVDGAARWVTVGPLGLQVSFIVLPAILVLYARTTDAIGTAGIVLAACAVAAQPDRAMAGALVAGTGAILLVKRSRPGAISAIAAVIAFAVTMLRPDTLPPQPFVEHVLYSAFEVHMLIGLVVVAGCLILAAPALSAVRTVPERAGALAFGASWAATVAAAALGNYPTPLVGYGASAVLGYLISAGLLPGSGAYRQRTDAVGEGHAVSKAIPGAQ